MSQRREKRLRQLERRVSDLEHLAAMPTVVIRTENESARMAMDAEWAPAGPKRSILQRIVDFFSGK